MVQFEFELPLPPWMAYSFVNHMFAVSSTAGTGPSIIAQWAMIGIIVSLFVLVKRAHGYAGIFFALGFVGILCTGYHGLERLNNHEQADDVAGSILMGISVLALFRAGFHMHELTARRMEKSAQDGAPQPAMMSLSKPEGADKPEA